MKRSLIRRVAKYAVYAALLLFLYFLQEAPAAAVFGVRAAPVIGLFIPIAMLEDEFCGGLYGLAAGILCDTASMAIFGIASMLFLVMGCAAGLLTIYLVNARPRSAVLFTFAAAAIYGVICHYILYGVWGYEGVGRLLFTQTLPSAVLSALWALPLYFVVRALRDALTEPTQGD